MTWHHLGQQRTEVSDWISQIDYYSLHREMKTRLLPGTGQWFLDTAEYVEWTQSSQSSLLWLRGNGKIPFLDQFVDFRNLRCCSWNWQDKSTVSIRCDEQRSGLRMD